MSKFHTMLLACALLMPVPALALSCGQTVTADVTLTADLHCSTGWTALYVPTSGVTINLNGHTLSGTRALSGISVSDAPNVTLKGPGRIAGFWSGVNAFRSDFLNVSGVDFDQLNQGVIITYGQKSSLITNTFSAIEAYAIRVNEPASTSAALPSGRHYIAGNHFNASTNGIDLCGMNTGSSMIENNTFSSMSETAIQLRDESAYNTIRSNMITNAGTSGIVLRGVHHNAIETNLIEYGTNGIALYPEFGICRVLSSIAIVGYNNIDGNVIRKHQTGIYFGLGLPDTGLYKNLTRYNQLHDDAVGMRFRTDARSNGGTTNDYTGTATPVIDENGNNLY
jgi:hypothetical protein